MTTAITAAPPEEARASVQDSASAWASTPVSAAAGAADPTPGRASPSAASGAPSPGSAGSAEADRRMRRTDEPRRRAELWAEEDGLATAEYGIVMLAAVTPRGRIHCRADPEGSPFTNLLSFVWGGGRTTGRARDREMARRSRAVDFLTTKH